jgi:hypothetical protein
MDPAQALRALLQPDSAGSSQFPPNSRYHGCPTATLTLAGGRQVVYLRRRIVPSPEQFTVLQLHAVTEGDRLDMLAARYLGDPEQFWRLCDAAGAMRPEELTETPGATVPITLPHGVTGSHA